MGPEDDRPQGAGARHDDDRRRRARARAATQASILAAARDLFAEVGYRDARTSQIARRANVAQATLFRYFATKADLAVHQLCAAVELLVELTAARPVRELPFDALCAALDEPVVVSAWCDDHGREEATRLATLPELVYHLEWRGHRLKPVLAGDIGRRVGAAPRSPVPAALSSAVIDAAVGTLAAGAGVPDPSRPLLTTVHQLQPLFAAAGPAA